MAVSQSQIVDLLYKQEFGVTKTDTATNKSPSNENIPSPLLLRGDTVWTQADQIPGTAAATPGIVAAYTGASAIETEADNTTVPIGGIYPTWLTNLTYWIPPQFGATYNVQVWVDSPGAANPTSTGTQIFADGSGGTGQFFFNYQSGVLNFIGETIPAALTSGKVLYIVGYQYIGLVGVTNLPDNTNVGDLNFTGTTISSTTANGNITLTPNGTGTVVSTANIVAPTFSGNFSGNISGNLTIPGTNTGVVFNDSGLANSSSGFTFNSTSNLVTMAGNLYLGGNGTNASSYFNQIINLSNTALEIRGGWNTSSAASVNIVAGDYSNSSNWGKISIQGNVSGNSIAYHEANYSIFTNPGYGSGNVIKFDILNPITTSTTSGAIQVAGGIGITGDGFFGGNLSIAGDIANVNNISITNSLAGNTGNFSGNINSLNANLGNLATANYVNVASNVTTNNATVNLSLSGNTANFSGNVVVPNLTVNLELAGNTANFSGNIKTLNANLGNLATANYVNVAYNLNVVGNANANNFTAVNYVTANNANITANLTAGNADLGNLAIANFVQTGQLFNGNSNVTIAANSNVTVSVEGSANVLTFSKLGANVVGYIQANGTISAGAFEGVSLTSNVGNLTLYANTTGDNYVELRPSGNGQVDVGNFRIQNVGDPVNGADATNKNYVDNAIAGLTWKQAAQLLANVNISLSGTSNTLVIDGHPALDSGDNGYRLVLINQTTSTEEGIYVYNDTGNGSYLLTRSSDADTYQELEGAAIFILEGNVYANTGWTQSNHYLTSFADQDWVQFAGAGAYTGANGISVVGTVISANTDGVTTAIQGGNIVVPANAQFTTPNIGAATGVSLDLTGNLLAANINANALITAANIDVTYNVLAGNLSANSNLTVNNATVNLSLSGNTANFSGNVVTNNLTNNLELSGNTANFSGNVVTNNLTNNLELSGNTANFSGNVVVPNLTVNLQLSGNTANFSGNISAANANLGNLATANYFTGVLINGTSNVTVNNNGNVDVTSGANTTLVVTPTGANVTGTANVSGNLSAANASLGNLATANYFTGVLIDGTSNVTVNNDGNINLTSDGNTTLVVTPTGANITGYANISGSANIGGNLGTVGNISANNLSATNNVTANVANIASLVTIGNSNITWGTVTTAAITANQTIASFAVSGVTGVEWLIKGIDAAGSKYSVATVQAVTNGSSVDYAIFGGVNIGGTTGSLAVNVVSGNIALQVTPASANSTVWVSQFRLI